jgi:hypothetical protein
LLRAAPLEIVIGGPAGAAKYFKFAASGAGCDPARA